MIKKFKKIMCGFFTGHHYEHDYGYGGGDYADVWCDYCNFHKQVLLEDSPAPERLIAMWAGRNDPNFHEKFRPVENHGD